MKTKSLIYYALISSIFLFSLVSIWKILVMLQGVELKNLNFAIIITLGIAISLLNLLIGEKLNYLIKSIFFALIFTFVDGYIVQESNTGIGGTDAEVQTYFGSGSLSNINQQRNFSVIADASWDSSASINVTTELPHDLSIGSEVELVNVTSSLNTTGTAATGFNRHYEVIGISLSLIHI